VSQSARSVKDCLTVAGMSLPLSHLAGSAVYRESAQASIAGQINGSGGVVRYAAITGESFGADCQRDVVTHQSRASRPTSALNPADPWPFDRIAPQSEREALREWLKTAPEAPL
jgi:hypothetical protein